MSPAARRLRPGAAAGLALAAIVLWTATALPRPADPPPQPPADAGATVAAWWPLDPPEDHWRPAAFALLPTGDLIAADRHRNRLFHLAEGKIVLRLPAPGRAPLEWTALAAAPGMALLALDGPGEVIHRYDVRGNYVGVAVDLAEVAADAGLGPIDPAGLAVDGAGHALVTDRLGDRILVFAPGWTFAGVWGESGAAPGAWRRPESVAVGDRAPFLVADEGNRRIVLLNEVGAVVAMRALPDRVDALAAGEDGGFVAAVGDTILRLDPTLATIGAIALPAGPGCRGEAFAAGGLAAGAGVVYVGEGCSGRIAKLAVKPAER